MTTPDSTRLLRLRRRNGQESLSLTSAAVRAMVRGHELHPFDELSIDQGRTWRPAWRVRDLFPRTLCEELQATFTNGADPSRVLANWGLAEVVPPPMVQPPRDERETIPVVSSAEDEIAEGWFILDGGQLRGPYQTDALSHLHHNGRIGANANVSRSRNGPWIPIAECVPLREIFGGTMPSTRRGSRARRKTSPVRWAAVIVLLVGTAIAVTWNTIDIKRINQPTLQLQMINERYARMNGRGPTQAQSGFSAGDRVVIKQSMLAFESASALRHYQGRSDREKAAALVSSMFKPSGGPESIPAGTEVTVHGIADEVALVEWYGSSYAGMATQRGWVLIEELK